jgi:hypothetical protein
MGEQWPNNSEPPEQSCLLRWTEKIATLCFSPSGDRSPYLLHRSQRCNRLCLRFELFNTLGIHVARGTWVNTCACRQHNKCYLQLGSKTNKPWHCPLFIWCPGGQRHLYDPGVSTHEACLLWHSISTLGSSHSLTLSHVGPVKPGRHRHPRTGSQSAPPTLHSHSWAQCGPYVPLGHTETTHEGFSKKRR